MTVNDIKRGPLANCIALHSFENPPESIKEWLDYSIAFFRKYALEPTRISSTKTDKTVSFNAGIKQLEKINYHVDGTWMGATPPNHNNDTFDSIFSILYNHQSLDGFDLCFDDALTGFAPDLIHTLTKDLSKFFGTQYGYAYQRLFSQGPIFYPFGTLSGIDRNNIEAEHITKWGLSKVNKRYPLGQLRDIYPYNFLSQAHLTQDIGGKTLKEWIEADPSHGKLFQLTETLWSWDVEKEQISQVKEKLKPSNIIICI
jgi:hypothetical protein